MMSGKNMEKKKKIHAMLFAIEHDPGIIKTVLMKYIFFIDLIHYNQRGSLFFNSSTYIRLPKGPVESEAMTLASESNHYFTVDSKPIKYSPDSKTYEACHFTAKQPCELSIFSPYEQKLMEVVLAALKGHQARKVSNLTHKLRLWKEFSDGDTIPLDYFNLKDEEISLLEKNGLYIDGFLADFCRTMTGISQEIADAMHPLNPEKIAAVEYTLDNFIQSYPCPSLDIFYDTYLAWDDTFRQVLRTDPGMAPTLTARCSDALCYISMSLYSGEKQSDVLIEYCEKTEDEFNSFGDSLTSNPVSTAGKSVRSLLDRTMYISRSMAMEMPPSGRK